MRAPGSIISTNTSGIPLAAISEGFDSEFRRHFLGTHFFNPRKTGLLAAISELSNGCVMVTVRASVLCIKRRSRNIR